MPFVIVDCVCQIRGYIQWIGVSRTVGITQSHANGQVQQSGKLNVCLCKLYNIYSHTK